VTWTLCLLKHFHLTTCVTVVETGNMRHRWKTRPLFECSYL